MMIKMPLLYRVGKLILSPIFKFYYNPTIIGKENIPVDDLFATMHNKMITYDRGDHLHLNEEGNTMVAAQVTAAIEAVL